MSRLIAVLFLIAANVFFASSVQAYEKRVALVIGNSAYSSGGKLLNPTNDATLMKDQLETIGFDVTFGIDLNKNDMNDIIDQFTEMAYGADIAFVYYAGHGMQVEGKNYLIPVDAKLTSPAHLKTRTIDMDDLIAALPSDPSVGIVILDACRDNPLARSFASFLPATRSASVTSGLASVQTDIQGSGAGGILIGYATDPGAVALDGKNGNSPYASALAKYITAPGLNIHSVLTRVRNEVSNGTGGRQRPWYNASLGRDIYLGGKDGQVTTKLNEIPVAKSTAGRVDKAEQAFWDEVASLGDESAYQLYLNSYPNGHFAPLARVHLKRLEAGEKQQDVASLNHGQTIRNAASDLSQDVGTQDTQESLNLDRKARLELQIRLKSLKFDPHGADGQLGRNSRKAISDWQALNNIPSTGYLTSAQYSLLLQQSEPSFEVAYQEYEARLQQTRSVTTSSGQRATTKSNKRSGGKSFFGDVGKFGAGVATGILACKLTGC